MLRELKEMKHPGSMRRLAPVATATRDKPVRNCWTAWWRATRLELHAVSIVMEGPCQSKKYEILLERMAREVPEAW
jgi:hypothetical protein